MTFLASLWSECQNHPSTTDAWGLEFFPSVIYFGLEWNYAWYDGNGVLRILEVQISAKIGNSQWGHDCEANLSSSLLYWLIVGHKMTLTVIHVYGFLVNPMLNVVSS